MILVVLDGSEHCVGTLEAAIQIAEAGGDSITVLASARGCPSLHEYTDCAGRELCLRLTPWGPLCCRDVLSATLAVRPKMIVLSPRAFPSRDCKVTLKDVPFIAERVECPLVVLDSDLTHCHSKSA